MDNCTECNTGRRSVSSATGDLRHFAYVAARWPNAQRSQDALEAKQALKEAREKLAEHRAFEHDNSLVTT